MYTSLLFVVLTLLSGFMREMTVEQCVTYQDDTGAAHTLCLASVDQENQVCTVHVYDGITPEPGTETIIELDGHVNVATAEDDAVPTLLCVENSLPLQVNVISNRKVVIEDPEPLPEPTDSFLLYLPLIVR